MFLHELSEKQFMLREVYKVSCYEYQFEGHELDQIQKEMLTALDDLKKKDKFKQREGWNSHHLSDPTFSENLLEQYDFSNFIKYIELHVRNYMFHYTYRADQTIEINSSWMTMTKNKEYGHAHTHGQQHISGCYYVQTNGEDGDFYMQSPIPQLGMHGWTQSLSRNANVKPCVGKLLLFPSWLPHGVGTNTTDSERVSLSFNITLRNPEQNA